MFLGHPVSPITANSPSKVFVKYLKKYKNLHAENTRFFQVLCAYFGVKAWRRN